jgi:hypothetical protein
MSHDGTSPAQKLKEMEHHNYLLRLQNLRLLTQLEKVQQDGQTAGKPDAVIVIEVKKAGE